jgi:hypothetical protein
MAVRSAINVLDDAGGLFGHGFASNFIFIVALVLIFLLGFAIRDALQKRGLRLRGAKKPDTVARRP